ncbi:MAG: patatin-like phospholipase family protein [Nitrospirae bacterium]|nr:patatin-like phospholipase family protein [Nitrospirota bacterium]
MPNKNIPPSEPSLLRNWLELLEVLKKCRVSIISIVVFCLFFILSDQFKDLYLSMMDSSLRLVFIELLVILWALIVWNGPRTLLYYDFKAYYFENRKNKPGGHTPNYRTKPLFGEKSIPGYLGAICFLVICCEMFYVHFHFMTKASNNIIEHYMFFKFGVVNFIIFIFIFLLTLLHGWLIKKLRLYNNIIKLLSPYYYDFYYTNKVKDSKHYEMHVKTHIIHKKLWFTKHRSIYNKYLFAVLSFFLFVLPFVFAVIASFDTSIWISLCTALGTVPLLLIALSSYSFFFIFLHWIVERFQKPVTLGVILFIALITLVNVLHPLKYHDIRSAEGINNKHLSQEEVFKTPEKVFLNWKDHMNTKEKYHPMFIIASYGGGIRAGYWTAKILSDLQYRDSSLDGDSSFAEHLIATSTVSGGSLGVVTFTNIVVANKLKGDNKKMQISDAMLREDFLSPVLGALLFRDIPFEFTPVEIIPFVNRLFKHDRAYIFEDSLAKVWKKSLPSYNDQFFNMFVKYENDNTIPLMLLNGTDVDGPKEEKGNCIVTGHINIQEINTSSKFEDKFIGRIDFFKKFQNDIPISTSVTMSCRFPFVLPPGHFDKNSVVDGGYYENSGAETALQFFESIEDNIKDYNEHHEDIIVPIFIQIANDSCPDKKDKSSGRGFSITSSTLNDLITPLTGILDTKDAHANNADQKAMSYFVNKPIPGCDISRNPICKLAIIDNKTNNDKVKKRHYRYNFGPQLNYPVPLGWYLSPDAADELDDQYKNNGECDKGISKIEKGQNIANAKDIIEILKDSKKKNPEFQFR